MKRKKGADKLGVKDPGVYQAYTAFDDGAGFAATGLAEATVEVRENETRSITEAVVSDIPDQTFTGKAIEPKPVVKLDGVTLAEGTDYTLSYENNVNPGEARVIITGTGKYTDSTAKTFKITSAIKPKTGDNSNTVLWFSLLGAAAVLGVGTVVANRKYSKKN